MKSTVTLELFSGRPDFSWKMSERDSAEIESALGALPKYSKAVSPVPPDLGYKGVRLKLFGERGLAKEIRFYRGMVSDGPHALEDKGRMIEIRLLKTGRGIVDEDLLENLLAGIKRSTY